MKTKLFIFIYSFANWGGAEHILLKVCRYLQQTALYDLTMIGLVDENPSLEKDFEKLGIKIQALKFSDKVSPLLQIGHLLKLKKILKKEKPAILMNVLFPCILIGGLVGKLAGVPNIIGNLHGPAYFKKRISIILDRFVSCFYKGYIAVASHIKDQFASREKIPANKITVVENGIEVKSLPADFTKDNYRAEWGLKAEDIVIGTIGRTYREKNQEYLVRITKELSLKFPNIKALIVGNGPRFSQLQKQVTKLKMENHCILAGWQTNTNKFLNIMDLFVLPSHYEGMPCSILEAWQQKIPVAGTNVPGIKDLIADNTNGILLPKDDPVHAAEKIAEILQDKDRMNTLKNNGYAKFQEKYTVEKMGAGYHDYFQKLIS